MYAYMLQLYLDIYIYIYNPFTLLLKPLQMVNMVIFSIKVYFVLGA